MGVDANADNLRAASQRAAGKPARGGLPNLIFGRLALEAAPGELVGLADEISVLLPWGSLLAAVAGGAPGLDDAATARISALAALGKADARLRVIFGHGPTDAAGTASLGLPDMTTPGFPAQLAARYRAAGLEAQVRALALDEVRALPTTWAKKLAFAGKPRRFFEVTTRRAR